MRYLLALSITCGFVLTGCVKSDQEKVSDALHDNPFFRALGAIPAAGDGYTGHGGKDGDTTVPVQAWRVVPDPEVNYEITVQKPYAEVTFDLVWPCTLLVVYTDLPDTSIRDTVVKPAPKIKGGMEAKFEFKGDKWQMTELSPCDARFDSGDGRIEIESVQVSAMRGDSLVPYPTLANTNRQVLDPYAYTFKTGDSVNLRLWEHDDVDFSWSYLHGPNADHYSPFAYDTLSGSWYGTWVTKTAGSHWVWFEVLDLDDCILNKLGPDRSVLWGLAYTVE
jgi:hypothetical protein